MLWIVRRFVLVHRDLLLQGRFLELRLTDFIASLNSLDEALKPGASVLCPQYSSV